VTAVIVTSGVAKPRVNGIKDTIYPFISYGHKTRNGRRLTVCADTPRDQLLWKSAVVA
jgi:hypothetical protein